MRARTEVIGDFLLRALLVMRGDGEPSQGELRVAFKQDGQTKTKYLPMLKRRRVVRQ